MCGLSGDRWVVLGVAITAVVTFLVCEVGALRALRVQERGYSAMFDRSNKVPDFLYDPIHGVKMGISAKECDDGVHGISIDWDPNSREEYTCYREESRNLIKVPMAIEYDETGEEKPMFHHCLDEPIPYPTNLPLSGPHRPLWPVFGEYRYVPPQRWLHSVEHGAAVLLYHPCMKHSTQLLRLRELVTGCLRKHVISAYRKIPDSMPFALVTYRHGIVFNELSTNVVKTFIKKYAMKGPEFGNTGDGQYRAGLLRKAHVVSDIHDSNVCPNF